MKVDEKVICRIATALLCEAELEEIRENLLKESFSEYEVFLAIRAGQVYNRMMERDL